MSTAWNDLAVAAPTRTCPGVEVLDGGRPSLGGGVGVEGFMRSRASPPRKLRAFVLSVVLVFSLVAVVTGGIGGVAAANQSDGATEIADCRTIADPGAYDLSGDVTGSETCLEITASDVVLDGMDHTIGGADVVEDGIQRGVVVDGTSEDVTNVTVRNVTVSNWDVGLYFNDVAESAATDVVTEHNDNGFYLRGARFNDVTNLTTRHNALRGLQVGSYTGSSYWNTFTNVTAYGNEDDQSSLSPGAIYLLRGSNNVFEDVTATDNQAGVSDVSGQNSFVDVRAVENSMYGVNVEATLGSDFEDVSVSRNGWNGIRVSESDENSFTNVTASENDGAGVFVVGGLTGSPVVTGTVIDGLTATDNTGSGIQLSVADDSTLSNLELINNSAYQLHISSRSSGNTVSGATISEGSTAVLVHQDRSAENTLEDVVVTSSDGGLNVLGEATTVTNATVRDGEGTAVRVATGLASGEQSGGADNVLTNVTVQNVSGTGVRVSGAATNNTLEAVSIGDVGTGVSVQSGTDNELADVTVTNSESDLELADARGTTFEEITLEETTISIGGRDVRIDATESPGQPPESMDSLGHYLEITEAGENAIVDDLEIDYDETTLDDVIESSLGIWSYHDGEWHSPSAGAYEYGLDDAENTVFARDVTEFGTFDVLGDTETDPDPDPDPGSGTSSGSSPPLTPASIEFANPVPDGLDVVSGAAVETIPVRIENTGDRTGDSDVVLRIDGDVVATDEGVTLAADEVRTLDFEVTPLPQRPGEYNYTFSTDDDEVSGTLHVLPADSFAVTLDEPASTLDVFAGEDVTVVASITNTGNETDTQVVESGLTRSNATERIDETDRVTASEEVTLTPGETEAVEFTHEAGTSHVGFDVFVQSADDVAVAPLNVRIQPFDLDVDREASVLESHVGEAITVRATVTNDGPVERSEELHLTDADGSVLDTRVVELAGGVSTTVDFLWQTSSSDAGSRTLSVGGGNDTAVDVIVRSPESVRSVTAESIQPGGTTTVTVDVELVRPGNVTIVESVAAAENVSLRDDDGADLSAVTDQNDEVVATYSNRETATLVFDVTIPPEAQSGSTYDVGGFVAVAGTETATTGIDAIERLDPDELTVERSIGDGVLSPDGSTTVTLDVTAGDARSFTIVEAIEGLDAVEIVDDDGADVAAVNDANDELLASYEDRQQVTLVYDVSAPGTASDDPGTIGGFLDVDGEEHTIGADTIDLTGVPAGAFLERTDIVVEETGQSMAQFSADSDVESIAFEDTVEGQVTVERFDAVPDSVDPPTRPSVLLTRITVPEEARDRPATIRMQVDSDEIDAGEVENLRIQHLDDTGWDSLETQPVEETDDTITLEAETPGFSFFAVTALEGGDEANDVPGIPAVVAVVLVALLALSVGLRRYR